LRALVKARAEPGLWLEDVPEPEIGINDVLIRVRKTGICGTDLHIHSWDAWAQEVSDSRTLGGVHYRFSNEAGAEMGKRIARAALEKVMRPLPSR